ncbi:hypothetical protein JCM11641_007936 [Rhodosporidiobolus odoratus]
MAIRAPAVYFDLDVLGLLSASPPISRSQARQLGLRAPAHIEHRATKDNIKNNLKTQLVKREGLNVHVLSEIEKDRSLTPLILYYNVMIPHGAFVQNNTHGTTMSESMIDNAQLYGIQHTPPASGNPKSFYMAEDAVLEGLILNFELECSFIDAHKKMVVLFRWSDLHEVANAGRSGVYANIGFEFRPPSTNEAAAQAGGERLSPSKKRKVQYFEDKENRGARKGGDEN